MPQEIDVPSVMDYTIFVVVDGVRRVFYATTSKTIMPGETCNLAGEAQPPEISLAKALELGYVGWDEVLAKFFKENARDRKHTAAQYIELARFAR